MLNEKEIVRFKLYMTYLISKKTNEFSHLNKNKKKVIVALAADYGNLGDVAITYAQTKFLMDRFPNYQILDFPISKTFSHMKELKSIINSDDVITIVGGGNMGDMYDDIEFCRQFIIKQFPDNKIISFPQTVDYSETKLGDKYLKRAKKIYSNHKRLTLVAREEKTNKIFKNHFSENKILLSPDIVLSLNEVNPIEKREGILFSLRNDEEKNINKDDQKELIDIISSKYCVRYYDTHIDKSRMTIKEREASLNDIWKSFRGAEVVITDRLHGMIFCAITNTPCIAIDNSNKKVSGVYKLWLEEVDMIKMSESVNKNNILEIIEEMKIKKIGSDETKVNKELFKHLNKLMDKL